MPDQLLLHDIVAACRVGVTEQECQSPQPIWLDLELAIDAKRAASRDNVADAVDYAALVAAVKARVEGKTYRLLETMAEEVAALILKQFRVPEALVRIKKRALPGVDYAAVEIVRRVDMSQTTAGFPTAGPR